MCDEVKVEMKETKTNTDGRSKQVTVLMSNV